MLFNTKYLRFLFDVSKCVELSSLKNHEILTFLMLTKKGQVFSKDLRSDPIFYWPFVCLIVSRNLT